MSQYLLSFARQNLEGRSDAYLALLWCLYKANQSRGRYSDHIKSYITTAIDELLGHNYQRIAARFKKVLDGRPELDWVAPSGLSPLKHLRVKNFRGFGEFGSDDQGTLLRFGKSKNIFYAPNGGGKSSLCEALEFGTTADIKEAGRRKTKVKQYIGRGSGKFVLNLIGMDNAPVIRSLSWSSCFIDRNRLQEFSLLGSKDTGSAEGDVLATLFGLEEFQEVISRFVRPESFVLKTLMRPDQANAVEALEQDRAAIATERRKHSLAIRTSSSRVCEHLGLRADQDYAVRARYLRLPKLIELRIRKAERLRGAQAPTAFEMRHIERACGIASRLLQRKESIEAEFVRRATAVNYRAVYKALEAIEETEAGDACPACLTPLDRVTENPFERARQELQALGALEELKISKQRNDRRLALMASKIATGLTVVHANVRAGVPCQLPTESLQSALANFHAATDRAEVAAVVLRLFQQLHSENAQSIGTYLLACEQKHNEVAQAEGQAKRLENQAANLSQLGETLRGLFDDKKAAEQAYRVASLRMAKLSGQKVEMMALAGDNGRFNAFVKNLEVEYGNLYRDLLGYKLALESSRITGIEAKAAEYYRAINDHDDEHEQIESLSFEKTADSYRIKISNVDGASLDAFSILSEGHLRALGLSLLLAMAQKNKFPLIVFDDVVNAIDSDHRSNIIDLIFSDAYLRQTQMVVTTHDRLFWERFCIIAERHRQSDQHTSSVLSYTNKGIVVIDHAGGFQEKVHRALSVYDIRQALIYCRIWFESMVLEYCIDNAVSVTAHFNKSQLKKNMYLQVSLESTFELVKPHIAYDLTHFNFIKNDLVNWGGQNQEHHAFDEGSLNFVHSKTSKEVVRIYDAIRLLECQLFPARKQDSGQRFLAEINEKIEYGRRKIAGLGRAPVETQKEHAARLKSLEKRAADIVQELEYIQLCLANIAQQTLVDQRQPPRESADAPVPED